MTRQFGHGLAAALAGALILTGFAVLQMAVLGRALAGRDLFLPLVLGAGCGLLAWLRYFRAQTLLSGLKTEKADLQEQLNQRTAELEMSNSLLQRLSIQDEVTGIASRRLFEEYFEREWRRAARNLTSISLILCEIDGWKGYIEKQGQGEAEGCLRKIVQVMKDNLARPADLAARYGDHCIAVLLPETHLEGAQIVAERLRRQVLALQIPNESSKVGPHVTISLGIVNCIPGRFDPGAAFIHAGEQALGRAKRAGHNRLQVGEFPAVKKPQPTLV